ncbi:MAG: thioredoxin fold domain-containing protein [Gammaproteobacteria bacterium]|nr:thioredoxin fold domain-containing protein [Gammaproteobacteria bacterium]
MRVFLKIVMFTMLLGVSAATHASFEVDDAYDPALDKAFSDDFAPAFDDQPDISFHDDHPSWFMDTFLELEDDLNTAVRFKKRGLMLYFGQVACAYCKALMERNFGKREIALYTRKHFDTIAINIHGEKSVTDFDGVEYTERSFSEKLGINFTPTLIFYDETGKQVFRLNGYQPPYKFQAILEYVADAHYREETLHDYMARGEQGVDFEEGALNEADFFSPPPHAFDRTRFAASRPLAIFFEEGKCHACDVLHSNPLANETILKQLEEFDTAQLNIHDTTPLLTPTGQRTTVRDWVHDLGLFYAPTIIFFDEHGQEIIRIDSVIGFRRLRGILSYIQSGTYRRGASFQKFRRDEWLKSLK